MRAQTFQESQAEGHPSVGELCHGRAGKHAQAVGKQWDYVLVCSMLVLRVFWKPVP